MRPKGCKRKQAKPTRFPELQPDLRWLLMRALEREYRLGLLTLSEWQREVEALHEGQAQLPLA